MVIKLVVVRKCVPLRESLKEIQSVNVKCIEFFKLLYIRNSCNNLSIGPHSITGKL